MKKLLNTLREMNGDFLDGSDESLARALKAARFFYLVVCTAGIIGEVVIVTLGILRHLRQ